MNGPACGGRPKRTSASHPLTALPGWGKTTWRNSGPIGNSRRLSECPPGSPGQYPQRVVAIDAPEDVVRQEQSIDIPAPLPRRVRRIFEVLVRRLQEPEVQ